MPAKGWKKNAAGESVPPSDPTHPDYVAPAATAVAEPMVDPAPEPSEDLTMTVDSAGEPVQLDKLPDGMTQEDFEDLSRFSLPDWDRPADDTTEPAVAYWCGAFEGGPRQCYNLAGVSFPLFTEKPGPHNTPRPQRTRVKGCIQTLTASQVERVKHAARTLVVRRKGLGKDARQIVINADPAHFGIDPKTGRRVREYVRQPGDMPVGCFIFIVPFDETLGPNWQSREPERLIPFPPTS